MDETTHGDARNRWATVAWITCSVLLVALVVGFWLRLDREHGGADLTNAIVAGERPQAPDLPTEGLRGQVRIPSHAVLVVNWWASWCGPCEDEAPELRDLADDYDGRVTVVGINAGAEDLRSDARAFVKRHRLEFPMVRGDRSDKERWGVKMLPETFVVGTDGRISAHVLGPIDTEEMRELLDRELGTDRSRS